MSRADMACLGPWLLAGALLGGGCADDMAPGVANIDAGPDIGAEPLDTASDRSDAIAADVGVPFDLGPPPTEPPLTVPICNADAEPGATCCASALGFEDGSTSHFLTPGCCKMALSKPQIASTPTACGRGALRLDADFRATDANSLCGQPGEAPACAYQIGEVSRAVLAPLDLTGMTMSAMVFLDGPALPAAPVHASLFVLAGAGLIEGPAQPLSGTGVWIRVDLPIADDGNAPGADVRIIGVRVAFHGQMWLGRLYIDEITWH